MPASWRSRALTVARRFGYRRPRLAIVVHGGSLAEIRRQLEAARAQSLVDLEVLLVATTDVLRALGDSAGEDFRVKAVPVEAWHPADARREGARLASAEWLLFAGPGTELLPSTAERLLEASGTHGADLVVGRLRGPESSLEAPATAGTLGAAPWVARAPVLARMLVHRRLWERVRAADPGDPEGQVVGIHLLREGFVLTDRPVVGDATAGADTLFSRTARSLADPWPVLVDRISWDRAVLAGAGPDPTVRAHAAAGRVARELPVFTAAVERADPAQWQRMHRHAAFLVETAGNLLIEVGVEDRAAALLASNGDRAALERFVAARRHAVNELPTEVRDGKVMAVLPETGTWEARLLELAPAETALRARVHRCRTDRDALELELHAAVAHVSDEIGEVSARVALVGQRGDRIPLDVVLTNDPAVTRWLGERAQRHDRGVILARAPLDAIPSGSYGIDVELEVLGVRRAARVSDRDPRGSATRLRRVGDDVRLDHPLPPAPSGPVVDARVAGERLVMTSTEGADQCVLEGPTGTLEPASVDGDVVCFVLRVDGWLGRSPAPSGNYRLATRGGGPVPRVARELLDRLPEEVVTPDHRVGLWAAPRGGLQVRLDPPLLDDEMGPFAQRRLQRIYREVNEPLDPGLVYFQSFTGQWPNDHPLAIQRELWRRRPGTKMRWLVADTSSPAPEGAEPVLLRSRAWYETLARAGYVVTNIDLDRWFTRRPGQEVLQTYHGYPSKAMGIGQWRAKGMTDSQVREELERTSGSWTALLTPQPDMDEHYRREYAYDGRILSVGYPRDDALVRPESERTRDRTRQRLGIAAGTTAVLYAPTWRDDLASDFRRAEAVHHFDVDAAARALSPGTVILQRGHRFHAERPGRARGVIDVTGYPDVNDLILAADVAVLDYSSLRFDFALTEKPMVFLVPDLEEYTQTTRGFLYDFAETAPGPLVRSSAEVVQLLRDVDRLHREWHLQIAGFNQRFNRRQDGAAARRVVDAFFGPLLTAAP